MRNVICLLLILISTGVYAQYPTGDVWYLRYINDNSELNYVPPFQNINLEFVSPPTNNAYAMTVQGISNVLEGNAIFADIDPLFGLIDVEITTEDCNTLGCDFEELLFYSFFTNPEPNSQLFEFYEENYGGGKKTLEIINPQGGTAYFINEPIEINDLFNTWYLFRQDIDLDNPVFYDISENARITINEDFTYTGTDGCTTFSGNLIYGEDFVTDFRLVMDSYIRDSSNCEDGNDSETLFYEFIQNINYQSSIYEDGDNFILTMENTPGFTMYFTNSTLGTPKFLKIEISLYPNPTSNFMTIDAQGLDIDTVSIYDILGKLVTRKVIVENKILDVEHLNSGIYFTIITTSSGTVVRNFIKK